MSDERIIKCKGCSKDSYEIIPIARIIAKLDELFATNDLAAVGKLLEYWEREARNLGDVRGLLDDLLRMCSRVVGKAEEPVTPETVDDYIQDVRTLWALYAEAFKVCTDFFGGERRSKSQNSPTIQLHDAQA